MIGIKELEGLNFYMASLVAGFKSLVEEETGHSISWERARKAVESMGPEERNMLLEDMRRAQDKGL